MVCFRNMVKIKLCWRQSFRGFTHAVSVGGHLLYERCARLPISMPFDLNGIWRIEWCFPFSEALLHKSPWMLTPRGLLLILSQGLGVSAWLDRDSAWVISNTLHVFIVGWRAYRTASACDSLGLYVFSIRSHTVYHKIRPLIRPDGNETPLGQQT